METGQYIRILAEFVTGEINFSKFKQVVEDRLLELRQQPKTTNEQRLLSNIELHLHEAKEGLRSEFELYAHAQSILDNIVSSRSISEEAVRSSLMLPNVPLLLSKTFDVDPEQPQLVSKELTLAESR